MSFRLSSTRSIKYKKNKKHHRLDGPAIIKSDGTEVWYKEGNIHREDGPAIIDSEGAQYWYKDGKCYNPDGQPSMMLPNGTGFWYNNGRWEPFPQE